MDDLVSILETGTPFKVNYEDLYKSFRSGKSKGAATNWFKTRLEEYNYIEGEDYQVVMETANSKTGRGRSTKTYLLSIDMAKELAMLENTPLGRNVRQYFITAEKDLKKVLPHVEPAVLEDLGIKVQNYTYGTSILESCLKAAKLLGCSESTARANAVQVVKREVPDVDFKPLLGENVNVTGELLNVTQLGKLLPTEETPQSVNLALVNLGLQVKLGDRWVPTQKAEEGKFFEYLDVGKKSSNGTPVQQIKWYRDKTLKELTGVPFNPMIHTQTQLFDGGELRNR